MSIVIPMELINSMEFRNSMEFLEFAITAAFHADGVQPMPSEDKDITPVNGMVTI